ncbi:MAG: DUF255 domain-containing protein, partial [Deltaproteobacteria bacterium]|nr:DUF255 domain-containing protein [Deltaproteobacteria bacterium]
MKAIIEQVFAEIRAIEARREMEVELAVNQRSSRKKGCTGRRQHRARGLVASGAVLLLVLGADPLLTDRGWSAAAGPPPAGDPELLLRLEVQPSVSRRGETLALSLHATIPAGFKLYGMARVEDGPLPTRLALTLPPGLEAEGGWFAPDPVRAYDASFRKEVAGYREQVSFRRGLRLGPAAPGGALPLQLSFSGQICDEHRCLLQRRTLDGTVVAEEGEPRPELLARPLLAGVEQPPEQPPTGGGSRAGAHAGAGAGAHADVGATTNAGAGAGEGDEGLLGFLLVAFLAGLLALLTPCVFPMVPLTVSFFSRAAGESFGRVLRLAGTYAGSIVLTFTVAGMVISAVFGAAGLQSFAAHPLFNLAVASILVAFGLSLLGLFEIRVPSALIEASERWKLRFGSSGGSQGTAPSLPAVFFMALTFTLVSFSCTVAFLGVVLVSAAQGHWLRPALGMLSFSTAFALPFFLLALFPQLATRLQRQGGDWLELVKVLLGVLELAAALKFFSNVDLVWGLGLLPRSTALVLWLGLFTVAALYLLRFVRLPGDDGGEAEQRAAPRLGVGRLLLGVATIGLLFYLSAGLFRNAAFGSWVDGWLPPLRYPTAERADAASGGQAEEGSAPIAWLSTLDEGLRRARQDGRLLFLNFTGVTCTNCRYMEEAVLSRPEVAREIRRYVAVELFTDRSTPEDEANRTYQISTFRTAALPLYAVVTPEQRVLASFPGSTNDAG